MQLNALFKLAFASAPDLKSLTRSEEHTSELQSHSDLVCRLLLEAAAGLEAGDGGGLQLAGRCV